MTIADVNVAKGQEAVTLLSKEHGKKVSFIKTDVTKVEELEGRF